MSLIIIGKVTLGSLGAVAVGVSAWLFYGLINQVDGMVALTTSPLASDDKKFKCTVGSEVLDCNVLEVADLDAVKNNQILSTIFSTTTTLPTPAGQLSSDKYYKIKIAKSDFEQQNIIAENETPSIIQVSKDGLSIGSIYVSLYGNDGEASINVFVGQADKDLAITANHKCAWKSEETEKKECTIFPFVKHDSDNDQSAGADRKDLTFTQTDIPATQIKQHHYYLIEFTGDDDSKDLKNFTETDIVYLQDNSSSDKILNFSKLSAATYENGYVFIYQK